MNTSAMAHPRRLFPAWPVVPVMAGLFLVGFFGGLWIASAAGLSWKAASLVAVAALAAVAGMTWYASRARADRRWRAALDRYAERQMADGAHPPDQHLESNRVHLQRRAAS